MADVSLSIKIGNKTYPITVDESEEKTLLKAAELFNNAYQKAKSDYKIDNPQDLLAIVGFDFAVKNLKKSNVSENTSFISEKTNPEEMLKIEELVKNLNTKIESLKI